MLLWVGFSPKLFAQNCSGLASFFSEDSLRSYLSILTSDSLEGREAGQPGQRRAASYLALHFERQGLRGPGEDAARLQGFNLKQEFTLRDLNIGGRDAQFLQDYYHWPGVPSVNIQSNKVVFGGYGISDKISGYDSFQGLDVSGQVVMVLQDEPMDEAGKSLITGGTTLSDWSKSSRMKTDYIKTLKPSVILVVTRFFQDDISKWGHYLERKRLTTENKEFRYDSIPVIYISEGLASEVLRQGGINDLNQWKELHIKGNKRGSQVLTVPFFLRIEQKYSVLPTENVAAYAEGTDLKQEYIVLTAHYDHLGKKEDGIYRGADDNGTGTAAIMEVARVLRLAREKGIKPRRSILILLFTAEEKGLLGSDYYVRYPLLPLKEAVTNLNIDMIGRRDPIHADKGDYIYIIGSNFLSRELHDVNEEANRECVGINLDYTFNDPDEPNRLYYRSDHYNFARHNIPCIFYFSGLHEDYHRPTDTIEKLDINLLKTRTTLVFETLWRLANREYRPALDEK